MESSKGFLVAQVCPKKGSLPPTFLFFSETIGTQKNPIRSGMGLDS